MSASDKKKLRKEEKLAKLTERQQAEQKEAKQLKVSSIAFLTVIALVLCIGVGMIVYNWYTNSGLPERLTTAVEFGDHKLSAAELNYFYIDSLNQLTQDWYSMYLLQYNDGFKSNVALNEQQYKDQVGKTWADHFTEEAIKQAAGVYAVCDAAKKDGFTLTEADKTYINDTLTAFATEGSLYGYTSLESYLQAMYGKGAQEKTYRAYVEACTLAQNYYEHYTDNLSYTAEEIAEKENEVLGAYNNYTYTFYTVSPDDFLEHASEDEHDHSDEELAEALKQAEAVAKELAASGASNKKELDAAIANLEMYKPALPVEESTEDVTEETTAEETTTEQTTTEETTTEEATTEDEESVDTEVEASEEDGEETTEEEDEVESISVPTSTEKVDVAYDSIPEEIAEWLAAEGRKEGDIASVPYYAVDDNGEVTEKIDGYFVVIFESVDKHETKLVTVRHILVEYTGGTPNEDTGDTEYSEAEKQAARDEIAKIQSQFESGAKTEDSFAELAKAHSDDNADDGGLYKDVYPGWAVENFDAWCFQSDRKAGDYGVVETEFGVHLIYFVEQQETTYREYMITSDLRAAEAEEWYTGLQDGYNATAKVLSTDLLRKDLVLSN